LASRERKRQDAHDSRALLDRGMGAAMAFERRERRHHDFQPQQRRGVLAHGAQRRDYPLRRLGPRDRLAERRERAGRWPFALPEQQANLLE